MAVFLERHIATEHRNGLVGKLRAIRELDRVEQDSGDVLKCLSRLPASRCSDHDALISVTSQRRLICLDLRLIERRLSTGERDGVRRTAERNSHTISVDGRKRTKRYLEIRRTDVVREVSSRGALERSAPGSTCCIIYSDGLNICDRTDTRGTGLAFVRVVRPLGENGARYEVAAIHVRPSRIRRDACGIEHDRIDDVRL